MFFKTKELITTKYIIYGISTIFGRGLEYLVILFVSAYLSKEVYGEFEFYKRTIEFLMIIVSFGTPTLILSYTKSSKSKANFLLISIIVSVVILLFLIPILSYFGYVFLWRAVLFYSLFFYSNSIVQVFNLVENGSNRNALYKIIGSLIFNSLIVFFVIYSNDKSKAIIYASTFALVIYLPYLLMVLHKYYVNKYFVHFRKYFKLFLNLLYGSFTLVLNSFINIAFLTTDIFIIKLFTDDKILSNTLIANYSFPLTLSGALIIISLTISQVEVEKVKRNHSIIYQVISKINTLTLISSILLFISYYLLVNYQYTHFKETIGVFSLILIAKIFQALSVPYGMIVLIKKKFNLNLKINLFILLFNLLFSIVAYEYLSLYGIALISLISLILRYFYYRLKLKTIL